MFIWISDMTILKLEPRIGGLFVGELSAETAVVTKEQSQAAEQVAVLLVVELVVLLITVVNMFRIVTGHPEMLLVVKIISNPTHPSSTWVNNCGDLLWPRATFKRTSLR
jgi:hypothetical protein